MKCWFDLISMSVGGLYPLVTPLLITLSFQQFLKPASSSISMVHLNSVTISCNNVGAIVGSWAATTLMVMACKRNGFTAMSYGEN